MSLYKPESEVPYEFDVEDYLKGVRTAESKEDLVKFLKNLGLLTTDALGQAQDISNWEDFRKEIGDGLASESGTELYGCILIPLYILALLPLCKKYGTPLGVAYNQVMVHGGKDLLEKLVTVSLKKMVKEGEPA